MNQFLNSWSPRVLSVLRIIAGFLILWHGSQKLFGYPPSPHGAASDGLMIFAGCIEFFGGVFLLLGLFTKPAAFLLSGTMAVAYFMVHASKGKVFMPIEEGGNGGERAVIYCFVFLYLFFAGGGVWGLDNLIWKRSTVEEEPKNERIS